MFYNYIGLLAALLALTIRCDASQKRVGNSASSLSMETADSSNAHADVKESPIVAQPSTTTALTLTSYNSFNSSARTAHDEGFIAVLSDPDNKGIIVRSLIVLAALTVLIVVFFVLKLIRLRLKQRRRRRYDDGDRIEMQRLEDMDDEDNDEVEVFDQSSLRRGRTPNGKHQNGSLR